MKNNGNLQVSNILCSNLTYFSSLVYVIKKVQGLKAVDYPIPITNTETPLRIDIICDNGETWVKVIARNSKSIKDTVEGKAGYLARSILDQVICRFILFLTFFILNKFTFRLEVS